MPDPREPSPPAPPGRGYRRASRPALTLTLTLNLTLTRTLTRTRTPNPNPNPSPKPAPNPNLNLSPHPHPHPSPTPNGCRRASRSTSPSLLLVMSSQPWQRRPTTQPRRCPSPPYRTILTSQYSPRSPHSPRSPRQPPPTNPTTCHVPLSRCSSPTGPTYLLSSCSQLSGATRRP